LDFERRGKMKKKWDDKSETNNKGYFG